MLTTCPESAGETDLKSLAFFRRVPVFWFDSISLDHFLGSRSIPDIVFVSCLSAVLFAIFKPRIFSEVQADVRKKLSVQD